MKLITGLMIAGVLAGVAAPAFAASPAPAPAPSATPLGDSLSLEFSPEYGASPAFTPYKDSYIKLGFSHNLGNGFAWGVAVQDTLAPTNGTNVTKSGWQGETTLGYKWKQDAFTFGVGGGVGYNEGNYLTNITTANPIGGYYLFTGTVDWKLDSKWTWNVVNARWRNAFDVQWATPKVQTGVTYALDARQSVYTAIGYAWKDTGTGLKPDKINVALGYKLGF
jgi:hypothetical protein